MEHEDTKARRFCSEGVIPSFLRFFVFSLNHYLIFLFNGTRRYEGTKIFFTKILFWSCKPFVSSFLRV